MEDVFGSVPPIPGTSIDFDDEIEEAMADELAAWTFASLRGSVPAIPGMSDDFDEEIEDAMGAALAERYPWTVRE